MSKNKWAKYRKSIERLLESRYNTSILYELCPDNCAYCGVWAGTRDHVVPVSWMYKLFACDFKADFKSEIVPCCQECNSIAGSKLFISFREKKKYIQKKLSSKRKYKKFIDCYREWGSDDYKEELENMGYNLRTSIKDGIKIGKSILERIEYKNSDYFGEVHTELRSIDRELYQIQDTVSLKANCTPKALYEALREPLEINILEENGDLYTKLKLSPDESSETRILSVKMGLSLEDCIRKVIEKGAKVFYKDLFKGAEGEKCLLSA